MPKHNFGHATLIPLKKLFIESNDFIRFLLDVLIIFNKGSYQCLTDERYKQMNVDIYMEKQEKRKKTQKRLLRHLFSLEIFPLEVEAQ